MTLHYWKLKLGLYCSLKNQPSPSVAWVISNCNKKVVAQDFFSLFLCTYKGTLALKSTHFLFSLLFKLAQCHSRPETPQCVSEDLALGFSFELPAQALLPTHPSNELAGNLERVGLLNDGAIEVINGASRNESLITEGNLHEMLRATKQISPRYQRYRIVTSKMLGLPF